LSIRVGPCGHTTYRPSLPSFSYIDTRL